RMIFAWVERWLAQRRTREIFGVLLFLFFTSLQFIGPIVERYSPKHSQGLLQTLHAITVLQRVSPPGLAAQSISSIARGELGAALGWLIGLCGYIAVFVWLLDFRLRAQYRGENLSEAELSRVSQKERQQLRLGWKLPAISGPVSAVIEKELRVISR